MQASVPVVINTFYGRCRKFEDSEGLGWAVALGEILLLLGSDRQHRRLRLEATGGGYSPDFTMVHHRTVCILVTTIHKYTLSITRITGVMCSKSVSVSKLKIGFVTSL